MAKELSDKDISNLMDKIEGMSGATHQDVMREIAKAVGLMDDEDDAGDDRLVDVVRPYSHSEG